MPSRKCLFKLYPNATEVAAATRALSAHCKVYNTLLETSRRRYPAGLPAYNQASVCQDVKKIRDAHSWIRGNTLANSLQATGERLVESFSAFFRRIAAGEAPGYPRFKSDKRFSSIRFKKEGEGYRLHRKVIHTDQGPQYKYNSVTLSGIGTISLKGKARFEGRPTSAELIRRGEAWYLSVTFDVTEVQLARPCLNKGPLVFDAGITDLLTTLKYHEGVQVFDTVENPRWLKRRINELVRVHRAVSALEEASKKESGLSRKFPVNTQLKEAYRRLRSLHKKVRNQRTDFYEKLTTWMAQTFGHLITEELTVSLMLTDESKSSGLKRGISDAAWATGLLERVSRKAEEAGAKYEEIPTQLVKPTRRCSCCGRVKTTEEMPLTQRMYVCGCGFTLPRDQNACRNMARYSFEGKWWADDSGAGTAPETPSKLVWVE